MNIAILIPGIIRNYQHLKIINKIKEHPSAKDLNFYIFGVTYPIKGDVSNSYYFNKDVKINNSLNLQKVKNLIKFHDLKISDDLSLKEENNYDGRILSQWKRVKEVLDLSIEYSITHNIKYDLIIRFRWDLSIELNNFFKYIKIAHQTQKVIFGSYSTAFCCDQCFIGPTDKMIKMLSLVDSYFEYFKTEYFIKETKDFLTSPKRLPHNKNLRCYCQSEKLFNYHIRQVLNYDNDVIKVPRFYQVIRN